MSVDFFRPTGRISIACLETLDALDEIASEWDDLLGRSEIDGFFVSRRWSRAWYEESATEYRMFVVVARDGDGTLVGIAPLAVARLTGELVLVGQSFWGEYVGFLIDERYEEEVTGALCEAVARTYRGTWDRARFRFVGIDTRFERNLVNGFDRYGVALRETNVEAAPFVALPSDLKAFYATKTSHFTKRIEYLERRLAKEGTVELKIAGENIGGHEAIELFWRLYEMRWVSYDPAFVSFHREFAVGLIDRREAIVAILFVGGKPVAARYDLVFAGKVWSYLGGWDSEWSRFEVGNVLIGRLLAISIERGQTEYDFLAGDAEYKRRWATGIRGMVDLASVATYAGDVATLLDDAEAALGQVDGLAFINADSTGADPSGERRVRTGCRAVLSGWIAQHEATDEPSMAFATTGGRCFELSYGVPRADVADALEDERRASTGFQGVFTLSDFAPGSYELHIGIVHLDGSRCALLPVTFQFEVEAAETR